jgi:hypothetical protein
MYSVRYYPRSHITTVRLGTYYPWIRGHYYINKYIHLYLYEQQRGINVVIIQGDQKVSVQLMITTQKVTSNVQSVPLQTHIDTPNCVLEDLV